MHLVFDIFQGIGVAAAVGIRPFLPALAVGALAAGDVQISFEHTDYSFLQGAPFLLALALGAIALSLVERRVVTEGRTGLLVLGAFSLALGALLFAGSLAQDHYTVWPGYVAGVACAVVGIAATRPLLARVRSRLDEAAAAAVPLYGEGGGLLVAVLSVLAPPIGPIALALLLWLLVAGRRQGERKYAGLRILR